MSLHCCVPNCTNDSRYESGKNLSFHCFPVNEELLVDEQNGFRKNRACIDHVFSLTSIIRNRKGAGLSTFSCFIDMQKAFDWVDRDLLLYKLLNLGIGGRFYNAVKSVYCNSRSCVKLNSDLYTDWFGTVCGVRQGDVLSPSLFALFINDLAAELKLSNYGVKIGELSVPILLYADDIVLISENEDDLQCMLNIVSEWCKKWRLVVNRDKSNIVHFRPSSKVRSDYMFNLGPDILEYKDSYKYLGVVLDQFLEFNQTAKILADSAGRALGSLVNKFKKLKNMRFNTYTAIYNACVVPVNDYCAGIWGAGKLLVSETVQNRAARFFLGVHRFSSNHAVNGDIGWEFCSVRRKKEMLRFWNRCLGLDDSRLTKNIFQYDYSRCTRNWCSEIRKIFIDIDLVENFDNLLPVNLESAQQRLHEKECTLWKNGCKNKPKLRSYVVMKENYETENYVKISMSRSKRSILAQFRTGTLPLMIEVGRFRGLQIADRQCLLCEEGIEDEIHFLFHCAAFRVERETFFGQMLRKNDEFLNMNSWQKLAFVVSAENVHLFSNFIHKIFNSRQKMIYN